MKVGTSDRAQIVDFVDMSPFKGFKHALVFFGGLEGIEGIVEQEEHSFKKDKDVESIFDLYLNTCPEQGTRTIRTEEAILISMAHIYSKLRSAG